MQRNTLGWCYGDDMLVCNFRIADDESGSNVCMFASFVVGSTFFSSTVNRLSRITFFPMLCRRELPLPEFLACQDSTYYKFILSLYEACRVRGGGNVYDNVSLDRMVCAVTRAIGVEVCSPIINVHSYVHTYIHTYIHTYKHLSLICDLLSHVY